MLKLKQLKDSVVNVGKYSVVNTTPHPVNMVNDDLSLQVTIPCSGVLINAKAVTSSVDSGIDGVKYQHTSFVADQNTLDALRAFKVNNPDVVIIGSLIAAQAYPGLVVAMVAHPDYMRVAPADKKMLIDTYTVY